MNIDPELTVIIPCFNEGDILENSIAMLKHHLTGLDTTFEILLVDDGSTDSSFQIIKESAKDEPSVKGIRFTRNFGIQP